jgi:N-acetylmuramoyl-L-alanine amidase
MNFLKQCENASVPHTSRRDAHAAVGLSTRKVEEVNEPGWSDSYLGAAPVLDGIVRDHADCRMRTLVAVACLLAATVSVAPLVAVDVGHSLAAPGATSARGRPEFEFNRELAADIARNLAARGFEVRLIGADGDSTTPSQRTNAARGAHLFLSVHHDSVQPHYLQEWEYQGLRRRFSDRFAGFALLVARRNPQFGQSLACASAIGAHLRAAGLTPSRYHAEPIPGESRPFADPVNGVHYHENLGVLRRADMPAVLLEAGVIVNRAEEERLRDPTNRQRFAVAVVAGVQACLGGPDDAGDLETRR